VFDLLSSLTGGGPGRDTYVLIYAIYTITFEQISLGYGAAITVVLFAIIVVASLLVLAVQVRRRRPIGEAINEESEEAAATARTSLRLTPRASAAARAAAGHPEEGGRRNLIRLPSPLSRAAFGLGVSLLFFFFAAPIIWMIIASLQPFGALAQQPPALTFNLWLDGYQIIAGDPRWLGSLAVSLQTALLTTLFVIVLAAPPAYALARFELPGKSTTLALLILVQMVPAIVMAIPVLRIFQILGLTDTVTALVIVNVAFWLPLIIWLLRNFFLDVPVSLEKAARIDGCSRLGTLFRVTIPAARPGLAAASILILIGTWNEFLFAVILGNRQAVTITRLITGIQNFPGALNQQPPPNLLAAAAVVAVTPCLLLVLLFHRRIISGLAGGFVKG
jgi:ABC-type glycerol-3-phosphate transport system permease component